MHRVILSIRCY